MGGSSPNADFNFCLEMLCFCVCFCVVFMFPNVSKKKKMGRGWVGLWSDYSEFFSDFGIVLT